MLISGLLRRDGISQSNIIQYYIVYVLMFMLKCNALLINFYNFSYEFLIISFIPSNVKSLRVEFYWQGGSAQNASHGVTRNKAKYVQENN